MSPKELFVRYANIGTKQGQRPWEVTLIRKLNLLALFGTFNVTFCMFVFLYFNYTPFIVDCIWVLTCAPLVVFFNHRGMYLTATYIFSFIGFGMFGSLNLKMGQDSFAFLLYFPLVMSTVQMMGRREMLKHMALIFLVGFASYCVVLYGLRHQWLLVSADAAMLENLRTINLFFSLFTTLLFVTTITYEGTRQEKLIGNMLQEKEVLLAEVFHRVKNNMNIVTSLLNLKKNASNSDEVRDALEECRNRIFAMALVHQKIYSNKSFTTLDFKDYVSDLINALRVSIDGAQALIELECENIDLELSNAIPCGLILNELITNSFKHAVVAGQKLVVRIKIKQADNEISISYKDNGPGLPVGAMDKNTLGIDIIRSLGGQLDAEYKFGSGQGFIFDLKFPVKQ